MWQPPPQFGPKLDADGVTFRLYAPSARAVSVIVNGREPVALKARKEGWHAIRIEGVKPGARYHFLIDETLKIPDPASRFQPQGLSGDSEIADSRDFDWTDIAWKGRPWEEAVLYELHVGCFSDKGDYASIIPKLDGLAKLGITAIELMPLAEFPGARGWGYDGVLPFAPKSVYGTRAELKQLINEAHARGIMVFLDVVYNHFGPEGNFLPRYAAPFFTDNYETPWGAAINFESNGHARRFFIENALYWLDEFHLDGLRLDAVHAIHDASETHILQELARTIRNAVPPDRLVHLVLENDRNEARHLEYRDGNPLAFNAQWNDDIHHVLHVLLTKEKNGYYADYADDPVERFARCLREGFDYQGQAAMHRNGAPRGEASAHLPPQAFVSFLQNHDQIGNRALGERIGKLASTEKAELALTLLLLGPQIPMLFMGEEWNASTPFLYFCDFNGDLANAVREGRRKEFEHFPEFSDPEKRDRIPDPNAWDSFTSSRLNWSEMHEKTHARRYALIECLLQLRKHYIIPLLKQGLKAEGWLRIGDNVFEARWVTSRHRLQLCVNWSDASFPCPMHATARILWGNDSALLGPLQCQWSLMAL